MGRIVTGPKSDAGQRTVSLPTVAVEALDKHGRATARPARKVCCSPAGGVSRYQGAAVEGRRPVRRLAAPYISASTTCATTRRR